MRHHFKHLATAMVCVLVTACVPHDSYRISEGAVWNTTFHITYNADRDLDDSIRIVMRQVEMSLSPFNSHSIISRINAGQQLEADTLLRRIFVASKEVNRNSRGAFDPTVAPLVNLWGFGYRTTGIEPSQAAIDSIMPCVGINMCSLTPEGMIQKKTPRTEFNFSAITKGYGCDLVGEMLSRNGCSDYLVEIGGEISLSGKNPSGKGWRIMIDAPIDNDTAVIHKRMAVIEPRNGGVATSGNYRNYKETDDGKIWHTISTTTGRPAHTDLLSATVVAPNAMLADAYATSCMAMKCDSALAMIDRVPGVEALLVSIDPMKSDDAADTPNYRIVTTPGFPKILK